MAKSRRLGSVKKAMNRLAEGAVAIGFLGFIGITLSLLLLAAVVAGLWERAEIEARNTPLPENDIVGAENGKRGGLDAETVVKASRNDVLRGFSTGVESFIPLKDGRHPSQPKGSAVIPASPTDPWRRAHTRMQSANRLREAGARVLENRASLRKAAKHDRYLAALYADERTRAETSLVRREGAVIIMLTLAGLIAVWGLE